MRLTKRGFLQSLGSAFAAGKIADAAQAQVAVGLEHDAKMMALNPPHWIGGVQGGIGHAIPCELVTPEYWSWPSWKAKEAVERKAAFLRDCDRYRSGQFTSHEEKKQRWIRRTQYRKFMHEPWKDKTVQLDIQSWKREQGVASTLQEIREKLALQQCNPAPMKGWER